MGTAWAFLGGGGEGKDPLACRYHLPLPLLPGEQPTRPSPSHVPLSPLCPGLPVSGPLRSPAAPASRVPSVPCTEPPVQGPLSAVPPPDAGPGFLVPNPPPRPPCAAEFPAPDPPPPPQPRHSPVSRSGSALSSHPEPQGGRCSVRPRSRDPQCAPGPPPSRLPVCTPPPPSPLPSIPAPRAPAATEPLPPSHVSAGVPAPPGGRAWPDCRRGRDQSARGASWQARKGRGYMGKGRGSACGWGAWSGGA